ncbi:MAG: tetratricopeptide repeat protein [Bacteroidota bacterium]|jgi:tetratricopeptide (TPR) repeat protein
MKIVKAFILLLFLSTIHNIGFAQNKDEQLASQFFSNGEYDKAAALYEKLLNKNLNSLYLYDNLIQSLIKLKRLDDAENISKKMYRKTNSAYFLVDIGYLYKLNNKPDKAIKQFDEIIKKTIPNQEKILETSNAFEKRNELEYAIKSYLNGRKLLGYETVFNNELAALYNKTKQTQLMIDEYVNSVAQYPENREEVQGLLQNSIQLPSDFELLKIALIRKIKANPNTDVFYEMLIWFYVQRKDFDNALIQAKAIDKRLKEEGRKMMDLGYLAISNEKYDAATRLFNEVILLGNNKAYYLAAKLGVLEASNKKLLSNSNLSLIELKNLENTYLAFLNENGKTYYTAPSMRDLGKLYAYYLNEVDKAVEIYTSILELPGTDNFFKADCKLELGDLYVLKGMEWDAMLLYGQVDKDFLEHPLGQEAKLRNAKLSFYLGEFEWAKAQLDILKTATTQLIANNALELSLLIQDNTVDSVEDALKLFAKADLLYQQNKFNEAFIYLDSIITEFPKHALTDDIAFKKAQIYTKQKEYDQAIKFYTIVINEHGSDILGDNALLNLAIIYEKNLNNIDEAKKNYEKFIENYGSSIFINEVRKRYRFLRGDILN